MMIVDHMNSTNQMRGPNNFRNNHRQQNPAYTNMNPRQRVPNQNYNQQPGGMPQPVMRPQMPMQQPGMQTMPKAMQPPPMQQPGMPPVGGPAGMPQPMTEAQIFVRSMEAVVPGVVAENAQYKELVGENIYKFVEKQIGPDSAPKVTGMLIDVPMDEIIEYLTDFEKFKVKVTQALNLLRGSG